MESLAEITAHEVNNKSASKTSEAEEARKMNRWGPLNAEQIDVD
jgi:hypothetical protein